MSLILNIDTATNYGAVGLSAHGTVIAYQESVSQKDHASFLQPAILQIMKDAGRSLKDIDAVAVTIGPGSYTGLRVGLASAKGLCFALGKPLVTVSTLQVMAQASIQNYLHSKSLNTLSPVFCPMIDARRMEVFAAIYNLDCQEIISAKAIIIDENIFTLLPAYQQIIFSGNGSLKIKTDTTHFNVSVILSPHTIHHLSTLALEKFNLQQFADIAYCEPMYIKPFYTTANKS